MIKKTIITLFLLLSTIGCQKETMKVVTTKEEDIEAFLILTKVNDNIDKYVNNMYEKNSDFLKNKDIEVSRKPLLEKYLKEYNGLLLNSISWKKIKPKIIMVYSEVYSQEEIRDLINFYKTDTGKKLVEKSDILSEKTSMIIIHSLNEMNKDVKKLGKKLSIDLNIN